MVVADVDLDPTAEERLDGRRQLGGRGRVDEDHATRPLRDGGQNALAIRRGEKLRAENREAGDLEGEHGGFLLVLCTGSGWTFEVAIPRPVV